MKLYFVLVAPARPANVGAAARAMKTMGFDAMRLVAGRVHEEEEASWVAHGAQEILTQAEAFDTLPEALADMAHKHSKSLVRGLSSVVNSDGIQGRN